MTLVDAPGKTLHQGSVADLAETVGEVKIDHLVVPRVKEAMYAPYRVVRAAFGPVGVLLRLQVRFNDRLKHEQGRRLRHPIPNAGNAQGPKLTGLFLRNQYLPHRFRCEGAAPRIPRQFPGPMLHAIRLDVHKVLSIHPGRAAIAAHPPVTNLPRAVDQDIDSPDSATTLSRIAVMDRGSPRSHVTASPPTERAVSVARASSISAATADAPVAANMVVHARPMPDAPPVTNAVLCVRSIRIRDRLIRRARSIQRAGRKPA